MHYYQHNIGDYARDTGHLTVLEHGVYRLLLDWCYLNEKPITTDQAMRVGRGNPVATQSVLSEFFLEESEGWTHKRVVKEIADYHVKAEKNRQNGIKGGRPKPTNNLVGSQTDAKHNPNQEPLTNNQEPLSKNATIVACPHIEILELYANILPSLPQPHHELWEGSARAKALRERWIWLLTTKKKNTGERYATTKEEGLEWFSRFFAYVSASDFLMGRAGKWSCDLGWLVKAENFAKVMQGNFENQKDAA